MSRSRSGYTPFNQKTISLSDGELTLLYEGNLLELSKADRDFVFHLLAQMQQYQREKAAANKAVVEAESVVKAESEARE